MSINKEQTLDKCHWDFVNEIGTSSINTKTFPSAYKEQVMIAMDEYAKQQSIAFAEWVGNRPLPEFSESTGEWRWWNSNTRDYDFATTEQLYQLFLDSQSK